MLIDADLNLQVEPEVVRAAKLCDLPTFWSLGPQTVICVLADLLRVACLWQASIVWHVKTLSLSGLKLKGKRGRGAHPSMPTSQESSVRWAPIVRRHKIHYRSVACYCTDL